MSFNSVQISEMISLLRQIRNNNAQASDMEDTVTLLTSIDSAIGGLNTSATLDDVVAACEALRTAKTVDDIVTAVEALRSSSTLDTVQTAISGLRTTSTLDTIEAKLDTLISEVDGITVQDEYEEVDSTGPSSTTCTHIDGTQQYDQEIIIGRIVMGGSCDVNLRVLGSDSSVIFDEQIISSGNAGYFSKRTSGPWVVPAGSKLITISSIAQTHSIKFVSVKRIAA